jgi:predicted small lipoprotein YifL
MRAPISLLVLAALLAACGYKGPLYLPKPKPEAQSAAPEQKPQQKTAPGQ